MDKCREAFEKNRFWVGIFRSDVVFKSEIGEFGLYEALNSKVEAEYLVEFNNKWVIWYQCWQSRQAELDQAYADIETFAQAHQRECEFKAQFAKEVDFLKAQIGIKRDQIKGFESEIKNAWQTVEEKDKRIEAALSVLKGLKAENDLWGCDQVEVQIEILEKALRGEHD